MMISLMGECTTNRAKCPVKTPSQLTTALAPTTATTFDWHATLNVDALPSDTELGVAMQPMIFAMTLMTVALK